MQTTKYNVQDQQTALLDISQGCVAMPLWCRGIFNNDFIANLPVNLPVQEISVSIWRC